MSEAVDAGLGEALAAFGLAGRPRRRVRSDPGKNTHWIVPHEADGVVVRRYVHRQPIASVEWELAVLRRVKSLGWPAPAPLGSHITTDGTAWAAFEFLPGRVRPHARTTRVARDEQRRRGALLAEFHQATAGVRVGQRPTWVTRSTAADNSPLAGLLHPHRTTLATESERLLRELDATRRVLHDLGAHNRPVRLIHGDFARWNLRFNKGRLTGLLDWEFAHLDDPMADFAWAWRGRYTAVIEGYEQVTPLGKLDRALIEPLWRAWVLDGAVHIICTTPPGEIPYLDWVMGVLNRIPEPF